MGFVKWISGEEFDGYYEDGYRTGEGIYTAANGDKYVGEFQNGAPNGQGILYEMRPFSTPTESTTSALFIVTRANFVDGYAHGPISEVWYMNDGDIIAWDDYDLEYGYIPEDDLVYGTVASGGNTYNSDLTITGGNFACGMPPWAEEASVVESVAASTTPPGIPGQEWPEEPEPPEIETLPTVDLLSVYIHPDYSELTLDWDWGGMTAPIIAV